jgi:hypothetical protein
VADHSLKLSDYKGKRIFRRRRVHGVRILDIASCADINDAANLLVRGSFGFVHFANIIGLFCEPSLDTVGDMNEFKGSERAKPVSITARMDSVPPTVDWGAFPPELPAYSAWAIASSLNQEGPVGFIFPASNDIPDHLTVKIRRSNRTVQVITAGEGSPFDDFVLAATSRIRTQYFAATSANISSYSVGVPEPVHYRMRPVLKEFRGRAGGKFFALANLYEQGLDKAHPHHDARSTTIVRLFDIARDAGGEPLRDPEGRHILEVARWGSMDRELTEKIISKHGYGVLFPANRVERRSYTY